MLPIEAPTLMLVVAAGDRDRSVVTPPGRAERPLQTRVNVLITPRRGEGPTGDVLDYHGHG
jgi:hypothetical protein